MFFFMSKFRSLKKKEVDDSIALLEKQEQIIEDQVAEKQEQIDFLLVKGRKEKSDDLRLLYAKKINHLKDEIKNNITKGSYLLYNIRLLEKLGEAIENKEFFLKNRKVSLGPLLKDQKNLAKFLNKALNTKIEAEEVMTSADEIFNEIQTSYESSNEIYGINKSDDEILAIFDLEENEKEIEVLPEEKEIEEILPVQEDK